MNGRFNTAAKTDSTLATASGTATRAEHRNLVAAYFLDPAKGQVFQELSHSIHMGQSLLKTEKWESTKETLAKWTQNELEAMLQSGRYIQRDCPSAPGVWEYQDTQSVVTQKKLDRVKCIGRKHTSEMNPETKDEDNKAMSRMWRASGASASFHDKSLWANYDEDEEDDGETKLPSKHLAIANGGKAKTGHITVTSKCWFFIVFYLWFLFHSCSLFLDASCIAEARR